MSLTSNAYFKSLKSMFSYSVITTISQVVSQFDDEDAFRRYLECNCVNIEKDLTEEDINAILDKWPEFFDNVNVELNDGEEKEVLKPDLQLDSSTYKVTFDFSKYE